MDLQFAHIFSARRKELGYTQEDVAQYIGVSRAAVSKWEKGQSYPDITVLPRLATYCNLSIDALLGYEPQLTEAHIVNLYKQLANRFFHEPFTQVEADIEQMIRDYYTCMPFLLKMTQLYINYSPVSNDIPRIVARAEALCQRVQQYSDDINILQEARMLEGLSLIMQQRPQDVLEKLGNEVNIQHNEEQLIARAYQMLGQTTAAKEVLQVSAYQHLFSLTSALTDSLLLTLDQPQKFHESVERLERLLDDWHVASLNPNSTLVFYIMAATGYTQLGQYDEAMRMLSAYTKACQKLDFPLTLRGDHYFDQIDNWLQSKMQLATVSPRDEASIKRDLYTSIAQNPAFAPLTTREDYQLLLKNLQHIIEGSA